LKVTIYSGIIVCIHMTLNFS